MIETKHATLTLTLADLPGPDTRTKREALAAEEPRQQKLLEVAAETGWPEAYTDDLYRHDMEMLATHPDKEMLWILRANGTHLCPLACENSHEVAHYRQVINYWSGDHRLNISTQAHERARYFLVSNTDLHEITADEAKQRINVRQGHE